MKIRNADAEEFAFLRKEIARGANLDAEDLLTACRYASETYERYQLLLALVNGYAAHQARIAAMSKDLIAAQMEIRKTKEEAAHG